MDYTAYVQQLYQTIQQQANKINELEKRLEIVEKKATELVDRPAIRVDKIEYKFDQLKVEQLDGTLNIGLNPADLQSLANDSDVSLPNQNQHNIDPATVSEKISSTLKSYTQEELPLVIEKMEKELSRSLSPEYHEHIQQDLLNQIDSRADFYQRTTTRHPQENAEQWTTRLIEQGKQDIHSAVKHYIMHLPDAVKG
ncbi:spore germination protein GerPC [Mangrovibacillus cuniculi]|uniref:Spore gernimation protein n=1 Tax=Mangrovibacillus cuniculi TaxID=2593652 RepID=A0A7S8C9R8_9BACI|nr:spore germination protein GerPC [Mangrovibacillus cuniculi]QPC46029.1 spore gernimation protein [Mangrovibacillus cuniculi]